MVFLTCVRCGPCCFGKSCTLMQRLVKARAKQRRSVFLMTLTYTCKHLSRQVPLTIHILCRTFWNPTYRPLGKAHCEVLRIPSRACQHVCVSSDGSPKPTPSPFIHAVRRDRGLSTGQGHQVGLGVRRERKRDSRRLTQEKYGLGEGRT